MTEISLRKISYSYSRLNGKFCRLSELEQITITAFASLYFGRHRASTRRQKFTFHLRYVTIEYFNHGRYENSPGLISE